MRRPSFVTLVKALLPVPVAVGVNLATGTVLHTPSWWPYAVWGLTAAFMILGVAVDLAPSRREVRSEAAGPDEALALLVPNVRKVLREYLRQADGPVPMPVRWHRVDDWFCDHPSNIQRTDLGEDVRATETGGRLAQLAASYLEVPSRRMVVLGGPGAGKTVLAARLAEDLLGCREPAPDLVPVIVNLGSWHPNDVTLRQWLEIRIAEDYLHGSDDRAAALRSASAALDSGRVLPILDGFDEVAPGLRGAAINAVNEDPAARVVLTSRREEFVEAVRESTVVLAAACVELTELAIGDVAQYLPRTAVGTRTGVWDEVLRQLRSRPDDPVVAVIAAVLASPLMLFLARAIYSDGDHDPAELLDADRFGSNEALEDHLLEQFVVTAYRRRGAGRRRRQGDAVRATRWLRYLANHLHTLGTQDLAWWRLGDSLDPARRLFAFAVVIGAADGLLGVVVGAWRSGGDLLTGLERGCLSLMVGAGFVIGLRPWLSARRNRT